MIIARKDNIFANKLLAWFQLHGRHHLPWQQNPTPYRVWVSEIMLQQTQVTTVINYYQSFINKFSSIESLSKANQDDVLSLWSGLGYYARARHLHRCAQIICERYRGQFPQTLDELTALPGIGRSTAGAILSFSMQQRAAILDGNVKRVLTRYHAVEGIPSDPTVAKRLWEIAESQTPEKDFAWYNQAIMDLGATICTRHQPRCGHCPMSSECRAHAESRALEFPHSKKTAKSRPKKSTQMLIIKNPTNGILLEKRPPAGLWGGLWTFPVCALEEDPQIWCKQTLNLATTAVEKWPAFKHIFTHFELTIHPIVMMISAPPLAIMESSNKIWYKIEDSLPGGIAAPVAKLLKQFKGSL